MLMNNIFRAQKELADITKKISQESKKENDASKRVLQIEKSNTKIETYILPFTISTLRISKSHLFVAFS